MTRLTLALVATFLSVSAAFAITVAPKERSITDNLRVPAPTAEPAPPAENGGLAFSDDTEVLVDGKACTLKEVPRNATIILLQVAGDKRTVLKIHFRTKKEGGSEDSLAAPSAP
jgi:hypothetical protein